jgi:FkbM family methyltransferase
VGAHRPVQHSNTFHFYNKGWRGINIDATPGSMRLFRTLRPRDINVEAAVSDKNESLTFFCFDQPLLNGFYEESEVQRNILAHKVHLVSKTKIETRTLTQLLDRFLPRQQRIDFLSIDVEGLDLAVLRSIDWNRYVPRVILIEILSFDFQKLREYEIYNFLSGKGYVFYSRTVNTLVFTLRNS